MTKAVRGGSNKVPPKADRMQDNHKIQGTVAIAIKAKPTARNNMPSTIIGLAPKRSAIAPPKIPKPCWNICLRPRQNQPLSQANLIVQQSESILMEIRQNPNTTNILSSKRKYLPRFRALLLETLSTIGYRIVIFCKYNTSRLDILTIVKQNIFIFSTNILELAEMFGYRIREPECYFITERLIIRLACETDANRLVNYYCRNENFLKPWEPIRDSSYYQLSAWSKRLHIMAEMHRRKVLFISCC